MEAPGLRSSHPQEAGKGDRQSTPPTLPPPPSRADASATRRAVGWGRWYIPRRQQTGKSFPTFPISPNGRLRGAPPASVAMHAHAGPLFANPGASTGLSAFSVSGMSGLISRIPMAWSACVRRPARRPQRPRILWQLRDGGLRAERWRHTRRSDRLDRHSGDRLPGNRGAAFLGRRPGRQCRVPMRCEEASAGDARGGTGDQPE